MLSNILYTSKNIAGKRKETAQKKFISDILAVGPWRIDVDSLARVNKYFHDSYLSINIEDFILPLNLTSEFIYYKTSIKHSIVDTIFILWRGNVPAYNLPNLSILYSAWKKRLEKIANIFQKDNFNLAFLNNIEFSVAKFDKIQKNRGLFPNKFLNLKVGRCLNKNGQPMDITEEFRDYGSPTSNAQFSVCTAQIPVLDDKLFNSDSLNSNSKKENEKIENVKALLLNADYQRARLSPLPQSILTDNTLGHWDLYWPGEKGAPEKYYAKISLDEPLRARDPAKDVVDDPVAIDFGTSSTVVAVNYKGKTRLIRVGEDNNDTPFNSRKNPFENPTALQFENAKTLIETWQSEPFRPAISGDDATHSHQAKEEINSHVKSAMLNLKTWARQNSDDNPLLLIDEQDYELSFAPPRDLPGIDIEADFQSAPLDPIELYAFYLGLRVNNQLFDGGGIFTDYYMTFPVRFERNVKDRIMASFRRGIIRSLPPSLIYAGGFDISKIKVTEKANEPAAFAAAALPALNRINGCKTHSDLTIKLNELNNLNNNLKKDIDAITFKEIKDALSFVEHLRDNDDEKWHQDHDNLLENLNYISNALRDKNVYIYNYYSYLFEDLLTFYSSNKYRELWEKVIELPSHFLLQDDHTRFIFYAVNILRTAYLIKEIKDLIETGEVGSGHQCETAIAPKPTDIGTAFGVFDFGGGTTDFAIGLYRLPTEEEELENGWETVVDILDVSGDPDLGGERLVHWLAFEVIRANSEVLIQNAIPFVAPDNAPYVSGTEKLFYHGAIARANTRKLMEMLRSLWEEDELDLEGGQLSETFENGSGEEKAGIKLNVDLSALKKTRKDKISRAVDDFFTLFGQAFKKANIMDISHFHVILAGNSCRSPLVRECFEEKAAKILVGGEPDSRDQIIIHPPLFTDPQDPEAVNMKTGVALGLLKTLDWEKTGVVLRQTDATDAPFPYTVGSLSHGLLKPALKRDCAYNEWFEFGLCTRSGAFLALYTLSPHGMEETATREECSEIKVTFGEGHVGQKIMVCATSPNSIRFALKTPNGKLELEKDIKLV